METLVFADTIIKLNKGQIEYKGSYEKFAKMGKIE